MNQSSTAPGSQRPRQLLYSISARIGGSGLDSDCFEALRASHREGFLGRALAYDNRQNEIPKALIESLRWNPVRLLSFLESKYYYGAKKHALDRVAASRLATGKFDLFHSWSSDCVRSLRVCKQLGIPSVLEIPTWHRNKGVIKPAMSESERQQFEAPGLEGMRNRLLVSGDQVFEEYALADLILVLSEKAAWSFRVAGVPEKKLFMLPRGTDIERFTPGTPPAKFRAIFAGALIQRKGVHWLLEAWHRLALKDAELVLVGRVHEEIKPFLDRYSSPSVTLAGYVPRPEDFYRESSVHIFPSRCEGSAKVTYDAAACGLPQITTKEAGDVVVDGLNGLVVPCGDVDALCAAIERLYLSPALRVEMGRAARARVVENFTWDHYRWRLLEAYDVAQGLCEKPPEQGAAAAEDQPTAASSASNSPLS
jgi:glycosyltransferase involved in cell wall biosynthesis